MVCAGVAASAGVRTITRINPAVRNRAGVGGGAGGGVVLRGRMSPPLHGAIPRSLAGGDMYRGMSFEDMGFERRSA